MGKWTWISRKRRRRQVALDNLLEREGDIKKEIKELRKAQSLVRTGLRKAKKERGKDDAERQLIAAKVSKLAANLQEITTQIHDKSRAFEEIAVLKQRVAA